MEKITGDNGRNLFVITVLILIGITVGFALGASLPMFLNQVTPEYGLIYTGFITNYGLMLIEAILAIVGIFFLLKNKRKNIFLLVSLLIPCFEYIISGVKFTFLVVELGFTFSFGQIGLGINFIGIILLVWYFKLKDEEVEEYSVNFGA